MTRIGSAAAIVDGTFLALLDQGEYDTLDRLGVSRSFPRSGLLMFEREPAERVMILLAGRVKVSRAGADGQELLLSIRDPGDVVGELGFIDGKPRIASVIALEPVEALVIPAQAFRTYLETTPRVAVTLLEVIARRFRDANDKLAQFASSDTLGRVSARVVELAERYGEPAPDGVAVAMPISQEELAAWAGASRAGVAHALQVLRDLGWIQTERRRVIVGDLDAVRARAA
jgi:CRP/FNR family transcriptional regulator, cyclic AMP receptor protein